MSTQTRPPAVAEDHRADRALGADIIIANAPDPVFVSDLEGKILQANNAVSRLLGFRRDELIEQSRAAAMVVVGSYGEGARSGMLAGSTALALVDGGGCPVAVIRGTAPQVPPPRRGPVVVGMDTGGDVTALHTGAKLADALGARLCVLHAWSDVTEQGQGVHRSTASGTELAARAVELLNARVAPLLEAYPALAVERHVVDDTALRALLGHASTARVVVVGHRRGRGTGGRLGSTSRGLVGFAPCPVVVTRGGP